MKTFVCVAAFLWTGISQVQSQHRPVADTQKHFINRPTAIRAKGLVKKLEITNPAKKNNIQLIITTHLDSLEVVLADRKKNMDAASTAPTKELADARAQAAWNKAGGRLNKLLATFLGKLSKEVSATQLGQVKDLLTEGGLKRESDNFRAMFPHLTEAQQAQILYYLKEARENALTGTDPKNRMDWFIKYRGRANNFLAAAGYDLRKATEALEAGKTAQFPE